MSILVLKGVSLSVPKGGIVALLGANGAGKTTTLKAISNLLRAERGDVTKGSITFDGTRVDKLTPNELVRRGCIQVLEGRLCFGHLTIEENLLTGAFSRRDGHAAIRRDLDLIYESFPPLARPAPCAGGLRIGRRTANVRHRPGDDVASDAWCFSTSRRWASRRRWCKRFSRSSAISTAARACRFLLAEQNAHLALQYAHHGYILENGRVVMDGSAAGLRENADVKEFYLGVSERGRRSFRDVKSYRRRKRWLA